MFLLILFRGVSLVLSRLMPLHGVHLVVSTRSVLRTLARAVIHGVNWLRRFLLIRAGV
jgi:hypothetical protein